MQNKKSRILDINFFLIVSFLLLITSSFVSSDSQTEIVEIANKDANIKTAYFQDMVIESPNNIVCDWTDPDADWKLCEVVLAVTNKGKTTDFTEKDDPKTKFKHSVTDMEVYTSPLDYTYQEAVLNLSCFDLLTIEQQKSIRNESDNVTCRYDVTRYSFNDWKLKNKLKYKKESVTGIKLIFKSPMLVDAGVYLKNQFNFSLFGDYDITLDPDVSACTTLSSEGGVYTMNASITNEDAQTCMNITANNVVLDCAGFTIDGDDSGEYQTGIFIQRGSSETTNVTIKNCVITDWYGAPIHLVNADGNNLTNIDASSCGSSYGIRLDGGSDYNTLTHINASSNAFHGIMISGDHNNISNVITHSHGWYGIEDAGGDSNIYDDITTYSNSGGFWLASSTNTTVKNSVIRDNTNYGIRLHSAGNNGANKFYNNLFNNTVNINFLITTYNNIWNLTKQIGTRIFGDGKEIAGNFWAYPNGTGYSETCTDSDKDGFCDDYYNITTGNIDYLPLSNQYSLNKPIDSCTNLNVAGATYTMTASISNSTSNCMNISANDITLDCAGFTIDGDDIADYGVWVERASSETTNITIKNCNLSDWGDAGVYIYNSDGNNLTNLNFSSNNDDGIEVKNSRSNILTNLNSNSDGYGFYFNNVNSSVLSDINMESPSYRGMLVLDANFNSLNNINATSSDDGFSFQTSSFNNITNVFLNNNDGWGFYMSYSNSNILINVTANSNGETGIYLYDCDSNILTNITTNYNTDYGFYIPHSDLNNLTNIMSSSNVQGGIRLSSSGNNIIKNSIIENNTNYGIYLYDGGADGANTIYNNIFNNTNNFYFSGTVYTNYWNTSKQTGTRIFGDGKEIAGNFWANPTGTGYSETCWDTTGDYICEDSYTLETSNIDYLPLTLSSDAIPPQYSNVGRNDTTIKVNDVVRFYANWTDENPDSYIFSWNESGSWINDSAESLTYWSNISKTITKTHKPQINWKIYANDSAGNWNNTGIQNFTINNTIPTTPSLTNPLDNLYTNTIMMNWTTSTDVDNDTIYYYVLVNGIQACYTTGLNCSYSPSDGYYQWNVTAYDREDNGTTSSSRHFTYDTITPLANYTSPTPADSTRKISNSETINVSYFDTNLNTCIFSWQGVNETFTSSDSNNFWETKTTTDGTTYTFQVFCSDLAGNINNTESRSFIENAKPIVASASINDSIPTQLDDLKCENGTTTDSNGDSISLTYDWYNNSIAMGINNSVLYSGNITTGDSWYCSIKPNDGYEDGVTEYSSTVSVGTSFIAPSINSTNATTALTNINSTSTFPTNNNSWINLSVNFYDSNADEEWTVYFCNTTNLANCKAGSYYCKSSAITDKTYSCRYNLYNETETTLTYYPIVEDNNSLSSGSSTSNTFAINYPPLNPAGVYPLNDSWININYTFINFTCTDVDTINYTAWGGTNQSNLTTIIYNGNNSYFNWTNLTDGTYYWKLKATDEHNYQSFDNSSIYSFKIDTTSPILTVSSPTNTTYYLTTIPITQTASDTNLDSCFYYILYTDTGSVYKTNTTISCNSATTVSAGVYAGGYTISVLANDSAGNIASESVAFDVATAPTGGSSGGSGSETTEIIYVEGGNFTLETEFGSSYYNWIMIPDSTKDGEIIITNLATTTKTFSLECVPLMDNTSDICSYVSFERNNDIEVYAGEEVYEIIGFNVTMPPEIEYGEILGFGIIATDNEGHRSTPITVSITIERIIGFITLIFDKLFTDVYTIPFSESGKDLEDISIPYIIPTFLATALFGMVLTFICGKIKFKSNFLSITKSIINVVSIFVFFIVFLAIF